jgi:hypothetical protein
MSKASSTLPETLPMPWSKRYQDNGECGCPLCGKMLKPKEKRRYIHVGEGGGSIMRADLPLAGNDEDSAVLSTGVDTGNMGWFEVGSGCARKLGLEWSKELPPIQVPVAV